MQASASLSVAAFLLAALAVSLITLCFAEVGSAYRDTGGPYLYAYRTFGPLVGFEVGWLMWVTQLGGFAAVINLFVNYVGWFLPGATSGLPRAAIVTTVRPGLTVVNVLGVRRAATINNILTLAKLLPLALFVIVGALLHRVRPASSVQSPPTAAALSGAVLVAVYAFSGFEVLGVPSGEIEDPARTIPFALLAGLLVVAIIYVGVQVVAIGTLPGLAISARPLADAAEQVFGRAGATVMVTGALISTLGVSHAILLAAGRMPFAMAERRQLPAAIAAVHPVYRTPWIGLMLVGSVHAAVHVGHDLHLGAHHHRGAARHHLPRHLRHAAGAPPPPGRRAGHISRSRRKPGGGYRRADLPRAAGDAAMDRDQATRDRAGAGCPGVGRLRRRGAEERRPERGWSRSRRCDIIAAVTSPADDPDGRRDDVAAILALYRKVAATPGGIARSPEEVTSEYVEGFVSDSLDRGIILVAELEGLPGLAAELHTYRSELADLPACAGRAYGRGPSGCPGTWRWPEALRTAARARED